MIADIHRPAVIQPGLRNDLSAPHARGKERLDLIRLVWSLAMPNRDFAWQCRTRRIWRASGDPNAKERVLGRPPKCGIIHLGTRPRVGPQVHIKLAAGDGRLYDSSDEGCQPIHLARHAGRAAATLPGFHRRQQWHGVPRTPGIHAAAGIGPAWLSRSVLRPSAGEAGHYGPPQVSGHQHAPEGPGRGADRCRRPARFAAAVATAHGRRGTAGRFFLFLFELFAE
jgi:hypothetical protein